MLKMLLDPMGGGQLTNDGHAILRREIEVSHPGQEYDRASLVPRDEEVGTGTTTAIIPGTAKIYVEIVLGN